MGDSGEDETSKGVWEGGGREEVRNMKKEM